MKSNTEILKGSVRKSIMAMAVPLLGGIYAMTAFTLADTYFVSRLGTQALAAISFTFPVTMVLIYFVLGVGVGTASVVARAVGAGDEQLARRLATDGLFLAGVFVIIEISVGLTTMDPLFRFLGAKGEPLVLIKDYMSVWYIAIGFFVLAMISNNIIRASGDAKFPSLVMMGSAVLNLILDPILIFGYFGCPAYGIKGAALATLTSFVLTAVVLLIRQATHYRLMDYSMPSLRQVFNSWKKILHVGLPSGMTNMIINLAIVLILRLLSEYGEAAVAGFGIALRIEDLALAVFHALGAALAAFSGQNWGARLFSRVEHGLKFCFKFCLAAGLILAVLLAVFGKKASLLFDTNEAVIEVAFLYLLIVPLSYGAKGVGMMVTTSFNAIGKPAAAMFVSLAQTFGIYVPLAYGARLIFGLNGIFAAAFAANALAGAGAYFWMKSFLRKQTARG